MQMRRHTPGLLVVTETAGCSVNCETNQQHRKLKKSFSPHFPSDASHLEPPQHTPPPPPPPPRGKLVWGRRRPCTGGSQSEHACRSVRRLSHTQTGRRPLERQRNTTFALDPRLAGDYDHLFCGCHTVQNIKTLNSNISCAVRRFKLHCDLQQKMFILIFLCVQIHDKAY